LPNHKTFKQGAVFTWASQGESDLELPNYVVIDKVLQPSARKMWRFNRQPDLAVRDVSQRRRVIYL
jgi:hypothetical protein